MSGEECTCDHIRGEDPMCPFHNPTPPADTASTGADVEVLERLLYEMTHATSRNTALAVLASDWLAAHDAATADRVRRETAESAWQAGHNAACEMAGNCWGGGCFLHENPYTAARIAREQAR